MSQTPAQYFTAFFAETTKAPSTLFEIRTPTAVHMINSDQIIEMLSDLPNDSGARTLAQQLRALDFRNAPVLPWLEHLATGYIRTNFA